MNEMMSDFIEAVFTPQFNLIVKQAFSLFEAFDHQTAYEGMRAAIMDESVSDVHVRSQQFSIALADELNFIVKAHGITLEDEVTISQMVTLLDALYRFQFLDNYITYESILESEGDAVDQMSLILEQLTEWDQGKILTMVRWVDPATLKTMQLFIETKATEAPAPPAVPLPAIDRMKLFIEACGQDNVGYQLMTAGMPMSFPLRLYLPFVENALVVPDNQEQTALNLLSLLYLSDVEGQNILTAYRELAEEVFKSLDEVGRAEGPFIKLLAKVEDLRKLQDEKARLSQAGALV